MKKLTILFALLFSFLLTSAQSIKKGNNSYENAKLLTATMLNQNRLEFLYEDKAGYHVFCIDDLRRPKRKCHLLTVDKAMNTLTDKVIEGLEVKGYMGAAFSNGKLFVYGTEKKKDVLNFVQYSYNVKSSQLTSRVYHSYTGKSKNINYDYRFNQSADGSKTVMALCAIEGNTNTPVKVFCFDADGSDLFARNVPASKNPFATISDATVTNDGTVDLVCRTSAENRGGVSSRIGLFYVDFSKTLPKQTAVEVIRMKADGDLFFKQDNDLHVSNAFIKPLADGDLAVVSVLNNGDLPRKYNVVRLDAGLQEKWKAEYDFSDKFQPRVKDCPFGMKLSLNNYSYYTVKVKDVVELNDGSLAVVGVQNGDYDIYLKTGTAFNYRFQFYGDYITCFIDKEGKPTLCTFTEYAAAGSASTDFMSYTDEYVTCNDFCALPLSDGSGIALLYNDCFKKDKLGYSTVNKCKDVSFKCQIVKKDGSGTVKNLTGSVEAGRVIRKFFKVNGNKALINTCSTKSGHFELISER
ncbi:MAG: hypothetical protein IKP37_04525 [Paludibacteraceae bacterium]|nr:hypothetical protein [Paludibacteraceae bacterium]